MNGNPYLAQVAAGLNPGALTATPVNAPQDQFGLFGGAGAPPPPPAAAPPPPSPPPMPEQAPPPPPVNGQVSGGGPNFSGEPPRNYNYGTIQAPPPRLPVTALGGGQVIPAHEVSRWGPSQWRAAEASDAMTQGAIDAVRQRSEMTAAVEGEMAAGQVRAAQARQAATEGAAAQAQYEMQQRQADFDQSVDQLSQTAVDPNRFWASRSTGQKIAAFTSLALGGFLQGMHGGSNPGLDALNAHIDRDIRAQEFNYGATRDTANAKQTAFSMAMQKYNNADVARSMARAAALDVVQGQAAQMSAMWKGTEAGNRADMAGAALQEMKAGQIAQGIAFLQASQTPRMYMSPEGIPMTEAEAKAFYNRTGAYGTEGFEERKIGLTGDEKVREEGAKAQLKQGEQTDQGAKYISQEMQKAGIPQALSHAEQARKAILAKPSSTTERYTPYAGSRGGSAVLHKAVFGQEASEREQAWATFKNEAFHALSGAAVSLPEEARYKKQLDAAGDDESRLAAIKAVETTLQEAMKNIQGGASVEAQRAYQGQRGATSTGTPSHLSNVPTFKPVK